MLKITIKIFSAFWHLYLALLSMKNMEEFLIPCLWILYWCWCTSQNSSGGKLGTGTQWILLMTEVSMFYCCFSNSTNISQLFIFSSWALICIFNHGWYNNFWHLHVVFAAGFYICWGCLVWVPSIYTSPGMYLVKHPVDLGLQACLLFLRIFISQINTIQLSCF